MTTARPSRPSRRDLAEAARLRAPTSREVVAERLAQRLDGPITILGIAALVLWLVEPVLVTREPIAWVVEAVWGLIVLAFLVEFVARAVVARETWPFLRRHWWEVAFLVLPFLRFTRALRGARASRGVMSALRSTRSAEIRFRNRLVWLALVTAVLAAASGRLLWDYGGKQYRSSYLAALHDATLGTLKGDSIGGNGFIEWLEVGLALYSVVIVAALASTVGTFFLERSRAASGASRQPGEADQVVQP